MNFRSIKRGSGPFVPLGLLSTRQRLNVLTQQGELCQAAERPMVGVELQRLPTGFRYVKTHMTVPGPMNHHEAVTRWVFER